MKFNDVDRWSIYDALSGDIISRSPAFTLKEALKELNRRQAEYDKELTESSL